MKMGAKTKVLHLVFFKAHYKAQGAGIKHLTVQVGP